MDELALLRAHVGNITGSETERNLDIYAADLVVEFPFAPEGHTHRLDGPEAMGRFLANIGNFTTGHKIEDVTETAFAGGFLVSYQESSTFRATGRAYSSPILWVAETADGHITRLREYYNPLNVLIALGDLEEPASA